MHRLSEHSLATRQRHSLVKPLQRTVAIGVAKLEGLGRVGCDPARHGVSSEKVRIIRQSRICNQPLAMLIERGVSLLVGARGIDKRLVQVVGKAAKVVALNRIEQKPTFNQYEVATVPRL